MESMTYLCCMAWHRDAMLDRRAPLVEEGPTPTLSIRKICSVLFEPNAQDTLNCSALSRPLLQTIVAVGLIQRDIAVLQIFLDQFQTALQGVAPPCPRAGHNPDDVIRI
jgi:hypothetical protein